MEYLQYQVILYTTLFISLSFKPYYKWNTFNTGYQMIVKFDNGFVLNLIINGIPSIQSMILLDK